MKDNVPRDPKDQMLVGLPRRPARRVLSIVAGLDEEAWHRPSCRRAGRRPGWSSTWAAPSGTGSRESWPAQTPSRRLRMRICRPMTRRQHSSVTALSGDHPLLP